MPTPEDDVIEWIQAAAKFGAPTVLIAFLLWWLTGDFNVRLRAIEGQHTTMSAHAERTEDLMGRSYRKSALRVADHVREFREE
jgi:hypothetical protein